MAQPRKETPYQLTYDVIFIDWDGTLSSSRFWEHWASDLARKKDHQLIQERFFQASPETLEAWMRGTLNAEMIVEEISKRTGLETNSLLYGLQESCEQMKLLDVTTLELIGKIRRQGTKVVVATDNMDTFTRWTVPALQLHRYFDDILNSHSLKTLKKDKKENGKSTFFEKSFKRYKIHPSQSLLLDDSPRNTVVKDFGMQYIRVTPQATVASILEAYILNANHILTTRA